MVGTEISKELIEETYRAVETAKATGKITKGCNETTKALERGILKLVVIAKDTEPKEVVLHLPALSREKGVICVEVPSREELGASAGLHVKTACVGIVKEGESKKILASITSQLGGSPKNKSDKKESEVSEEESNVTEEQSEADEENESSE